MERVVLPGHAGPVRAVYQYHARGILSDDEREFIKTNWRDKSARADLIKRFELVVPKERLPVPDEPRQGKKAIEHFRQATPNDDLAKICHIGSLHGDLRILHPSKRFAFGWTLDVCKAAAHYIYDGHFEPVFADRFLTLDLDRMVVVEPKDIMATRWLDIVTPRRKRLQVNSTDKSSMQWLLIAELEILFGVQKDDYAEYYIRITKDFNEFGQTDTNFARFRRFDIKFIQGGMWHLSLPKEQMPYALTHVYAIEAEKAKREGVVMIWTEEHLEKLHQLRYKPLFPWEARKEG